MSSAETIAVAIIGSGAFTAVVNAIISVVTRVLEQKSGVNAGIRLILKDRIKFLALHYIEQGWINADELEDLMAMHKTYHDELKGNGYLDVLMDKVKHLEIREDDGHEE